MSELCSEAMLEKARTVWNKITNRISAGGSLKDDKLLNISSVGTGPPATEVPEALAATIADDVINSRPEGSFVWTSGGHPDV